MERISGTVTRVNGTGFQLAGREGWLNVSKFAQDVALPAVGAQVAAELDAKGFVRRLEQAETRLHAVTESSPAAYRELTNTRLACLNTATAILGGGPGHPVDPAEVARLAARLEAWVRRTT